VIDKRVIERQALESVLRPLAEMVLEIGIDKPLADYSRAEVLSMVECIVDGYQAYMEKKLHEIYEEYFEVPYVRS